MASNALMRRDKVLQLQAEMEKMPGALTAETTAHLLSHFFAPGVYARQMVIPRGMVVVGKIHRHAHLNVLLSGDVSVYTEFHTERFEAPRVWVSEPGIKRAVYAHDTAVWLTVHHNAEDTTDLTEIERQVIAPPHAALEVLE